MAELNRRRKEVWQTAHERLRGLVGKAIDIVEKALNADDVKAALAVLKATNLYGNVETPQGETDADLVLVAQAEVWAVQELRRQGPRDDPLALLIYDGEKARLTRQRLEDYAVCISRGQTTRHSRCLHNRSPPVCVTCAAMPISGVMFWYYSAMRRGNSATTANLRGRPVYITSLWDGSGGKWRWMIHPGNLIPVESQHDSRHTPHPERPS